MMHKYNKYQHQIIQASDIADNEEKAPHVNDRNGRINSSTQ